MAVRQPGIAEAQVDAGVVLALVGADIGFDRGDFREGLSASSTWWALALVYSSWNRWQCSGAG